MRAHRRLRIGIVASLAANLLLASLLIALWAAADKDAELSHSVQPQQGAIPTGAQDISPVAPNAIVSKEEEHVLELEIDPTDFQALSHVLHDLGAPQDTISRVLAINVDRSFDQSLRALYKKYYGFPWEGFENDREQGEFYERLFELLEKRKTNIETLRQLGVAASSLPRADIEQNTPSNEESALTRAEKFVGNLYGVAMSPSAMSAAVEILRTAKTQDEWFNQFEQAFGEEVARKAAFMLDNNYVTLGKLATRFGIEFSEPLYTAVEEAAAVGDLEALQQLLGSPVAANAYLRLRD